MISHPGSKAPIDIIDLARASEKTNTMLEISTKHSELSIENISLVKDMNIEFALNSDAHEPRDIGEVTKGYKKAVEAGLDFKKVRNFSN